MTALIETNITVKSQTNICIGMSADPLLKTCYSQKLKATQTIYKTKFSVMIFNSKLQKTRKRLGKGNLIFCCTVSRESNFGSVGRQSHNNNLKCQE